MCKDKMWLMVAGLFVIPNVLGIRDLLSNVSSQLAIEGTGAFSSHVAVKKHETMVVNRTGNLLNPADVQEILARSRPLYLRITPGSFIKAELSSRQKSVGFFLMGCQLLRNRETSCTKGEWYAMVNKGGGWDFLRLWNSAYTLNYHVTGNIVFEFDDDLRTFQSPPFQGEYFLAESVLARIQLGPGHEASVDILRRLVTEWLQQEAPGTVAWVNVGEAPGTKKYGPYRGEMHSKAIKLTYEIMIPEKMVDSNPEIVNQIKQRIAAKPSRQIERVLNNAVFHAVGSRLYPAKVVAGSLVRTAPKITGHLLSHTTLTSQHQDWIAAVDPPLSADRIGAISFKIFLSEVHPGVWMATEASFHCYKAVQFALPIFGKGYDDTVSDVKHFKMDPAEMREIVRKVQVKNKQSEVMEETIQAADPIRRTSTTTHCSQSISSLCIKAKGTGMCLCIGDRVISTCLESGREICPVMNLVGSVFLVTPAKGTVRVKRDLDDGYSEFKTGDLAKLLA